MEIACSGFIYGLTVAASLVRTGVFKRVLLIGAEELSRIINYTDRSTAVLFGDGAGAVVLEASAVDSFLGSGWRRRNESDRPVPAGGRNGLAADHRRRHRRQTQHDHDERPRSLPLRRDQDDRGDARARDARLDAQRHHLADPASGQQAHHRSGCEAPEHRARARRHQHRALRQHQRGVDPDRALRDLRGREAQGRRRAALRRLRRRVELGRGGVALVGQ